MLANVAADAKIERGKMHGVGARPGADDLDNKTRQAESGQKSEEYRWARVRQGSRAGRWERSLWSL
jgi:hypothetical protein